ncbi:MAG: 30S ribosomal protein S1 [Deltaproteobacteria bacterium]|nr:30S ribosomal protein S1 [Deltaproteobacteria bacterium]
MNGTGSMGDMDDFEALLEQHTTSNEISEGKVVEGRIVMVGKDYVTVDIGYKSEGQIAIDEFLDKDGTVLIKEGDRVSVYVDELEDDHGLVQLSKDKAEKLKIWDEIEAATQRNDLVEGVITNRVKGGLTVDIGVKAFLPGSQVDLRPVRNLERYIGQKFQFRVIKFNKKRGNIVLSRRALLEREREELKKKTLESLEVGKIIDGIVKNITEYGCFVDLGGIDGLLHITDMSWGRINHPSEMFSVGDEVKVKILKFDPASERVSLGLKQISEDPWLHVTERYVPNQRITGKVVNLTDYGAFVELEEGIEGLVHVSEMSWTKRIKHPSKVVSPGDVIEALILDIDVESKRISLGMKQVEENPWERLRDTYPIGSVIRAKIRNITPFGLFLGIEDGIDGLVHVSDISWSSKQKNPQDMYQKGQEVDAKVLNIDVPNQRFSLGIKQIQPDPWSTVERRYPIGTVLPGKVTKILDFGAIVQLDEDIEGLVHISEISDEKIDEVASVLAEGQEVKAKVVSLIPEERKIGLSIRRVRDEEAKDWGETYRRQERARTGTMLGDVLKAAMESELKEMGVIEDEPEPEPVEKPVVVSLPDPPPEPRGDD